MTEGTVIKFPCRIEAKAHLNGEPELISVLRVDTTGRKFEAVMNCSQDPNTCKLIRSGGGCWAPIIVGDKKYLPQSAIICGKLNPNLQKTLDQKGGIETVPLVEEIKYSPRRQRPDGYDKLP